MSRSLGYAYAAKEASGPNVWPVLPSLPGTDFSLTDFSLVVKDFRARDISSINLADDWSVTTGGITTPLPLASQTPQQRRDLTHFGAWMGLQSLLMHAQQDGTSPESISYTTDATGAYVLPSLTRSTSAERACNVDTGVLNNWQLRWQANVGGNYSSTFRCTPIYWDPTSYRQFLSEHTHTFPVLLLNITDTYRAGWGASNTNGDGQNKFIYFLLMWSELSNNVASWNSLSTVSNELLDWKYYPVAVYTMGDIWDALDPTPSDQGPLAIPLWHGAMPPGAYLAPAYPDGDERNQIQEMCIVAVPQDFTVSRFGNPGYDAPTLPTWNESVMDLNEVDLELTGEARLVFMDDEYVAPGSEPFPGRSSMWAPYINVPQPPRYWPLSTDCPPPNYNGAPYPLQPSIAVRQSFTGVVTENLPDAASRLAAWADGVGRFAACPIPTSATAAPTMLTEKAVVQFPLKDRLRPMLTTLERPNEWRSNVDRMMLQFADFGIWQYYITQLYLDIVIPHTRRTASEMLGTDLRVSKEAWDAFDAAYAATDAATLYVVDASDESYWSGLETATVLGSVSIAELLAGATKFLVGHARIALTRPAPWPDTLTLGILTGLQRNDALPTGADVKLHDDCTVNPIVYVKQINYQLLCTLNPQAQAASE